MWDDWSDFSLFRSTDCCLESWTRTLQVRHILSSIYIRKEGDDTHQLKFLNTSSETLPWHLAMSHKSQRRVDKSQRRVAPLNFAFPVSVGCCDVDKTPEKV